MAKGRAATNVRWAQILVGLGLGVDLLLFGERVQAGDLGVGTVLLAFVFVLLVLVLAIALPNTFPGQLAPDYAERCPACNWPVNTYAEFCEHCGADLRETSDVEACVNPACRAELFAGTPFCPECGTRQPPTAASDAPVLEADPSAPPDT